MKETARTNKAKLLFVGGGILFACSLFAGKYWTKCYLQPITMHEGKNHIAGSTHQREKFPGPWDLLPILPNSSSSALNEFFVKYPFHKQRSGAGWIDVNKLDNANIKHLRKLATDIMGKDIECGYPRVIMSKYYGNQNETKIIPSQKDFFEYCMWDSDFVSSFALANFSFEPDHWMWVSRAFDDLHKIHNISYVDDDNCQKQQWLGFLDVGVNVADWISPLRLLHPEVPIYGVEGAPSTAAIATANFGTSVSYHQRSSNAKTEVAPSKLLPFSLTTFADIKSIHESGGVCFNKPVFLSGMNKDNIGGRAIATGQQECPPSDLAGATTLEHALRSLVEEEEQENNWNCEKKLDWPKIYIAKFDVEGFEHKAILSVIPWLSAQPPCYFVMEYWPERPTYTALIELLLDMKYDSVWLPKHGYPDTSQPWWNLRKHGGNFHKNLFQEFSRGYTEVIFGFENIEKCVRRILQA